MKRFMLQRIEAVWQGLTAGPSHHDIFLAGLLFLPYSAAALLIGTKGGVFQFELLRPEKPIHFILPITLVLFPCLPEEVFFRGLLLPRKNLALWTRRNIVFIVISSLLFVAWHPLNALLVNTSAIQLFRNACFLAIVFLLGIICAVTYMQSGSLWIPVTIHWLTVFVWVFFLGGRNKVLEFIK
jgi:predicted Abi (CAAX) family protease